MKLPFHIKVLQQELKTPKARQEPPSLRALARRLGLSPGYLSSVIKQQKRLSAERAFAVGSKLGLSPIQLRSFVESVKIEAADNDVYRRFLKKYSLSNDVNYRSISPDKFDQISDWIHFAILELCSVKGGVKSTAEVAARLGVSMQRVELATMRLKKMGLLVEDEGGFRRTVKDYDVGPIFCTGLRSFHKQNLALATEAIDAQEISTREFAGITIAITRERFAEIREKMNQLIDEVVALGIEREADFVYHFGMQFFRLDKDIPR